MGRKWEVSTYSAFVIAVKALAEFGSVYIRVEGPELFIYMLGPALSDIYPLSATSCPVTLAATQCLHSSYVTLPRGLRQSLCYDMDPDLILTDRIPSANQLDVLTTNIR